MPPLCSNSKFVNSGTFIKKIWQHPLARGIDVDHSDSLEVHRQILEAKPLLYEQHLRWYCECLPAFEETRDLEGKILEIGSGAGFLEQVIPDVIKTDSVPNPFAEQIMNAEKLDFGGGELKNIFLISVLHHIPFPEKFFREAERCLKRGGRLVMVEPSNNFLQRFLARYLDHYEYFDDTIGDWTNDSADRMTHANLALPWVIFVRDRGRFEKEFPSLKIKEVRYHTFLSHVLTGGFSYRSLMPFWASPAVNLIETLAKPFMERIGTMMTIDIVKQE